MDPMGIQMSPKDVLDTQRISKIWTMWTLKDMRMRILNSVNLGFVERCGKVWKGQMDKGNTYSGNPKLDKSSKIDPATKLLSFHMYPKNKVPKVVDHVMYWDWQRLQTPEICT